MSVEVVPRQEETQIGIENIVQPIMGDAAGKNLLSMRQLRRPDIYDYIKEAEAAESFLDAQGGVDLLNFMTMRVLMKQASTRTGGTFVTAMEKLGGNALLVNDFSATSEAKGESVEDGWVAFAAQADILGIRTAEEEGPHLAAHALGEAFRNGKFKRPKPVINLGDGKNEHPTQALGDLYTISAKHKNLSGLWLAIVGDHERYRANHSLMLGAAAVGMNIIAVESAAAPVPEEYVEELGRHLHRTADLDEAMVQADVLYMGRNPGEYSGNDPAEEERNRILSEDFQKWIVDAKRLQRMQSEGMVLHPRPRRNELHPSVDSDPRAWDVVQMEKIVPMRMAISARHMGVSIDEKLRSRLRRVK